MKLLRTERSIVFYNNNDNDHEIAGEVNIDPISVDQLLTIVVPRDDDLELYYGYILSEEQLEKINELVVNKIVPNFETYYYVLECFGIYDWSNGKTD